MRRKDREVTDKDKINEVISKCKVCRIGFNDNGKVYIVPLNFGFDEKDGERTLYFHGAKEGRKIDLIKTNPNVGFEMDASFEFMTSDEACNHSAWYQSIIGNGVISFVTEPEEKEKALNSIMFSATGKRDWNFNPMAFEKVCVFKLKIDELSCKEHMR